MSVLSQLFRKVHGPSSSESQSDSPIPVSDNDMKAITPAALMAGHQAENFGSMQQAMYMNKGMYTPNAGYSGPGTNLNVSERPEIQAPESDSGARFLQVHNE